MEASSPASDGSYEPQDPPAECDRRAPDLTLLRWLEGHGPEPDCHSNHSLCPATVHLALARYWLSPIARTLRPQPQPNPMTQPQPNPHSIPNRALTLTQSQAVAVMQAPHVPG